MKIGEITDYDKLTLEVWTNGTMKDKQHTRCKTLTEHLDLFIGLTDHINDVEIMVEEERKERKSIRNGGRIESF